MLAEKLKDAKLKGMVNELLDACVKITEVPCIEWGQSREMIPGSLAVATMMVVHLLFWVDDPSSNSTKKEHNMNDMY